MTQLKTKIESFYNGYVFPVLIASIILIGHIFGLIYIGVLSVVIFCCCGFLICDNLKFFIPTLFYLYFIISEDILNNESLYSKSSIIFFSICISALVLCIAAHFVIYKNKVSFKSFKESSISKGFALISLAFLLNGILAFNAYNTTNILFGFAISASFFIPFLICSINLKIDEKSANYLIYTIIVASILISAEFIHFYCTDIFILDGKIFKNSISLGWGVSNNIGGILTMLMPVYFYKACTSKYFIPFFLGGAMTFLLIIFTMSRTSMLISTFIMGCCLLYMCVVKNPNRKKTILLTLTFAILGIALLVIYKDYFYKAFAQIIDVGFSDSGRFEYYIDGINKFFEHPILGVGFGNSHGVNDKFVIAAPEYFHNTIVQVLASCGILGFIAYVFHRYETVKLFVKNKTPLSFFTGMMILALLLTSLLDIHMFNIFPAIFYSVILCVFERYTRELNNEPAKEPMLNGAKTQE